MSTPSTPEPSSIHPSLRIRAIPILLVVIAEILIGNQLAVAGSPYPLIWLIAHIAVGLLLVAMTGHTMGKALRRSHKMSAKGASALTFFGALGAVLSGFAFLFGGQSNGALLGMEVLGGLALLGSILLLVFGSNK